MSYKIPLRNSRVERLADLMLTSLAEVALALRDDRGQLLGLCVVPPAQGLLCQKAGVVVRSLHAVRSLRVERGMGVVARQALGGVVVVVRQAVEVVTFQGVRVDLVVVLQRVDQLTGRTV